MPLDGRQELADSEWTVPQANPLIEGPTEKKHVRCSWLH